MKKFDTISHMNTLCTILIIIFFSAAAFAQAGELDSTFSGDGIVTTSTTTIWDDATSVAVQQDGKIVAAGSASNAFDLVRYKFDGSLDSSFGQDGKVMTSMSDQDCAFSVLIQTDGKIVAA